MPFNDSDWFRKNDDVRWKFGVPARGNANFARADGGNRASPNRLPEEDGSLYD